MAESTTVSVSMETELVQQAETLLEPFGMKLDMAIYSFVRQIVNQQSLPLRPSLNVSEQPCILFERMRQQVADRDGFLTDDEINEEIQAARAERRKRGHV